MYIAHIYIYMDVYVCASVYYTTVLLQRLINAHHEYASDLDLRHKA